MAGILVSRLAPSCASIQPCATGMSDSRFIKNEFLWSFERRETVGYRNEFRPLRSVACIHVQPPITKLLKVCHVGQLDINLFCALCVCVNIEYMKIWWFGRSGGRRRWW